MTLSFVRAAGLALLIPLLSSCANLGYYSQAIRGHMDMMSKARPIEAVIADSQQPPELRERLVRTQQIRGFLVSELGLPDNSSYRNYVDLERPYAAWNVIAAPEFSVGAKQWCFLVAGCMSYRGYFSRDAAEAHAEQLRRQGYDVHVAGATAYSTLGWFSDPVLNTFFQQDDESVVALIGHELAHQTVYVKGDSAFNEAFAVAVSEEAVRRWFIAEGNPAGYARYQERRERGNEFNALLLATRHELAELYRQPLPADELRAGKQVVFAKLRQRYTQLKASWGGYSGYDKWMARDLNNAHLSLVATYNELVPALAQLLREREGDIKAFYRTAHDYTRFPVKERHQRLHALLEQAQPVLAENSTTERPVPN